MEQKQAQDTGYERSWVLFSLDYSENDIKDKIVFLIWKH